MTRAAEAEYMDAYMEVVRAVSAADDEVLHQLEQAEQPVTINNIEGYAGACKRQCIWQDIWC